MEKKDQLTYHESEKRWVFAILMCSCGLMGAFTYSIRGNVFCNAQTGNVVLLGMALGNRDFIGAAYLLIPISAYFLGAVVSEILPEYLKRIGRLRWDTLLIGFEIIVCFILGLIPEDAPVQISQIAINFICSMQYNTFRQTEGVPMATTFCTNHIRQCAIYTVKWFRKQDGVSRARTLLHIQMLVVFVIGAIGGTILCNFFLGKAIWGSAILLLIVFVRLIRSDFREPIPQNPVIS